MTETQIKYYEKRIEGKTYQEIADIYGVTRQAVHRALKTAGVNIRLISKNCIFPFFNRWRSEHNESTRDIAKNLGINYIGFLGRIKGMTNFTQNEIERCCKYFGDTYENIFKTIPSDLTE